MLAGEASRVALALAGVDVEGGPGVGLGRRLEEGGGIGGGDGPAAVGRLPGEGDVEDDLRHLVSLGAGVSEDLEEDGAAAVRRRRAGAGFLVGFVEGSQVGRVEVGEALGADRGDDPEVDHPGGDIETSGAQTRGGGSLPLVAPRLERGPRARALGLPGCVVAAQLSQGALGFCLGLADAGGALDPAGAGVADGEGGDPLPVLALVDAAFSVCHGVLLG